MSQDIADRRTDAGYATAAAKRESVRRAIRTLHARGLVERTTRWDSRPRKSLKRLVDLALTSELRGVFCQERSRRGRRAL